MMTAFDAHKAGEAAATTRSVVVRLSALLGGVLFFTGANALLTTSVALRAAAEGMSPAIIGLLGSAYFGGFIAGCLMGAGPVRRSGHIRAFAAFAAIATIATLLYPLALSPWIWLVLRFLSGWCSAVIVMIIESWLNTETSNEARGQVLSTYRITDLSSVTIAQFALGIFAIAGFEIFSVIAISTVCALIPVALTRASGPTTIGSTTPDLRGLLRTSPMAAAGAFGMGIVSGVFWGVMPAVLSAEGYDAQVVGWFVSAVIVGGAISQWPLGKLSDRIDRRLVIIAVAGVAGAAALGIAVATDLGIVGLLVMAVIFGAAFLPIYALSVAHANDFVSSGAFVPTASALLACFGGGAVLGPLLSGIAVAVGGLQSAYWVMSGVLWALVAYGLYRTRTRASRPVASKDPFVPTPRSTAQIFELDPRAPETEADAGEPAPAQP